MDLIQRITLSSEPGVLELPSLKEALFRLGFVLQHDPGIVPVTILTVDDSSFVASGIRSSVTCDLIGSMYEVKPSFRLTVAKYKK